MNRDQNNAADAKMQQPRLHPPKFGLWMAVTFFGHTLGITLFTGLNALILGIPARNLLVPYVTLVCCGLVLSPSLYWAILSRERPKSCAIRFGIAMFSYLLVLSFALDFSAVWLGILSAETAINDFAPFALPFSALGSVGSYVIARRMLKPLNRND